MNFSLIATLGNNNGLNRNPQAIKKTLKYLDNEIVLLNEYYYNHLKQELLNQKIMLSNGKEIYYDCEGKSFKSYFEILKEYTKRKEKIYILGDSFAYKIFMHDTSEMYIIYMNNIGKEIFPKFYYNEWESETLENGTLQNGTLQQEDYKLCLYKKRTSKW